MDDFGTSRTVHTVRFPNIIMAIKDIDVSKYYLGLNERKKIKERINEVADEVRNWLNPIIDLQELPYSYHANGTHNSIEQWMASESRSIYCFRGEYPYPSHLRKVNIVDNVNEIPNEAVVYMSNPFSSNGNYDNRYYDIKNPVILDIAYVGTTSTHSIRVTKNTEQVFWSASKPFGLGNYRTGYKFTRLKDSLQEQLKDTGYFNVLSVAILSNSLKIYSVTQLYNMLNDEYINICKRNDLIPSDSFLLATSLNKKYEHLKRENGHIRIPVGKILDRLNTI
jgi:hypothetical protein